MDHAAPTDIGNCCIARYSPAMPSLDYIMRRFRPIAPKPTTSAGSNHLLATTTDGTSSANTIGTRRGKRKATAARSNRGKKVLTSTTKTQPLLPLLPERRRPDDDDSPSSGSSTNSNSNNHGSSDLAIWWNFEADDGHSKTQTQVMMPRPVRVAGSIVTVECVTETWGSGAGAGGGDDATVFLYGLGCTDEEKMMMMLQMDACPAFISDGGDAVVWTNAAYRDMVGLHAEDEMRVLLAMKGGIMPYGRAFSCKVRMQYARGKDRCSLTLPCDVWPMHFGGYAWRLDVKAALSLGR